MYEFSDSEIDLFEGGINEVLLLILALVSLCDLVRFRILIASDNSLCVRRWHFIEPSHNLQAISRISFCLLVSRSCCIRAITRSRLRGRCLLLDEPLNGDCSLLLVAQAQPFSKLSWLILCSLKTTTFFLLLLFLAVAGFAIFLHVLDPIAIGLILIYLLVVLLSLAHLLLGQLDRRIVHQFNELAVAHIEIRPFSPDIALFILVDFIASSDSLRLSLKQTKVPKVWLDSIAHDRRSVCFHLFCCSCCGSTKKPTGTHDLTDKLVSLTTVHGG